MTVAMELRACRRNELTDDDNDRMAAWTLELAADHFPEAQVLDDGAVCVLAVVSHGEHMWAEYHVTGDDFYVPAFGHSWVPVALALIPPHELRLFPFDVFAKHARPMEWP